MEERDRLCTQIERREVWMPGEKRIDDRVVLFRLARTGRIDETSALSDDRRRTIEEGGLVRGERCQIGLLPAPPDVGIAPDRADARARGVHEHAVEDRLER